MTKGKRTTPIEWRSSSGERYVRVTANATHGMATIWDLDVILRAVSQLNEAVNKGLPTPPYADAGGPASPSPVARQPSTPQFG